MKPIAFALVALMLWLWGCTPGIVSSDKLPMPDAAKAPKFEEPLPPGASGRLGSSLLRQSSGGSSCAYAPGGSTFATGQEDGEIVIWDAATGCKLRTLPGQCPTSQGVECLAYFPDSRRLVSVMEHVATGTVPSDWR